MTKIAGSGSRIRVRIRIHTVMSWIRNTVWHEHLKNNPSLVQHGAAVRQDGGEGAADPVSAGDLQLQGRDQGPPGEAGNTQGEEGC
jgi:hypothetical protein